MTEGGITVGLNPAIKQRTSGMTEGGITVGLNPPIKQTTKGG